MSETDDDIERQAEKVVRTAERAQAPLLEALELVRSRLEESAKSLETALHQAKQALTVVDLLKHQVRTLRAKIEKAEQEQKE